MLIRKYLVCSYVLLLALIIKTVSILIDNQPMTEFQFVLLLSLFFLWLLRARISIQNGELIDYRVFSARQHVKLNELSDIEQTNSFGFVLRLRTGECIKIHCERFQVNKMRRAISGQAGPSSI